MPILLELDDGWGAASYRWRHTTRQEDIHVKHAILIGTLVTVVAAAIAVTAQGKNASTLAYTTKQHAFAQIDTGKKGFSIGDAFIFSEQLLQNGKQVGYDHVVCTHAADWPSSAESCTGTAVLTNGTLQLGGLSKAGAIHPGGARRHRQLRRLARNGEDHLTGRNRHTHDLAALTGTPPWS